VAELSVCGAANALWLRTSKKPSTAIPSTPVVKAEIVRERRRLLLPGIFMNLTSSENDCLLC
jgi:hypothetical protein